ncbi:MAG: GNAT family N-acetyltransferase [Chloroflexi bacterium]|nr:GNAT family N-acetyltransferase [Chloroflexota bacterium]
MNIIKLDGKSSEHYFKKIARIHTEEIHFGFLPLLGEDFLALLYFYMSQVPSSGVWIAEENGTAVGFVTGTADIRQCYRQIIKRAWFSLSWKVLRSIFRKDVLKKIPVIIAYPFQSHHEGDDLSGEKQLHHPELLSIAISADGKGKGIGRALVQALENGLKEWGVKGLYFVSTNSEDPNSNAFYQHVGFKPVGKHRHNDLILQDYQKEIPLI